MTPEIGHNNPPAIEAHSLEIEELFSLASGSAAAEVTNDEQEAALDALLADLRKARKSADSQRKIEKTPHDEAGKAIQTAWKPLLDKCDAATADLKKALTPYRETRQKAKDEAAQKARDEAAAKEAAALEALNNSSDLEEKFAAEAELKQANKLTAVANRIDRTKTGLRTYWEAEITDRKAALLCLIKRRPEAFDALLQDLADEVARGDRAPIDGVVFHERKKAA